MNRLSNLLAVTRRLLDKKPTLATWGAPLALALVAFLLRVSYLDTQSLWRDEMDVLRFANQPGAELIHNLAQVKYNGPLYYVLMRGWLALAGDSEFALRFLAAWSGVLTVPLTGQVGRALIGRRAAWLAALLAAISPFLVWYSQDAKMYALVGALTLLAMGCQLRALATGRAGWWAGFVAAASLSFYIHLLSALMIPVYATVFLLAWPGYRRRWRGWLASVAVLTLPYVPLVIWQLPLVINTYDTGHPFYSIQEVLASLFNLYTRGVALVGGWAVVAMFLFAILGGVFPAPAPRQGGRGDGEDEHAGGIALGRVRLRLFLLVWLFLPIGMVYLISLRAPIFEPRYMIFVAPAFYLLAGLGVMVLSRSWRPAAGLSLAVMLSFSLLGVWTQATVPLKSDFRAAAAYVAAHRQGSAPIMFHIPYVRYTFDYYFHVDYVALEGPWTNDGKTEAQVGDAMTRLLAGHADIWVVSSESWLWDSRGLVRSWLERHARLLESTHFALVNVYHYDLSDGLH